MERLHRQRRLERACWVLTLVGVMGAVACSAGGDSPGGSSGGGGKAGAGGGGGGDEPDGYVPPTFSCTPGEWGCYQNAYFQCGADGASRTKEEHCSGLCMASIGCAVCAPGANGCNGEVASVCREDAMGWNSVRDCAEWGSQCGIDGYCDDACGDAERGNSYIGCEYWPTPIANTDELDAGFDYRVVVGNPDDKEAAHVVVTRGDKGVDKVQWDDWVPPGGLKEIPLAWVAGQSRLPRGATKVTWNSLAIENGAYRLKSDRPITVAQFNPFDYYNAKTKKYSYTNDASLLLPKHVLSGDYVNLSYLPLSIAIKGLGQFGKGPGYLAIVGVSPEPTTVRVQVSAHTAAHTATNPGKFGALTPGNVVEFVVQRGEVVHMVAAPPPNCAAGRPGYMAKAFQNCATGTCYDVDACGENLHDMTGSRVTADRPVQVFGGHSCAIVPYHKMACDHLEVQLPPIQTWGKKYVGMPMLDGNVSGQNLVRVVAAFDDTQVTITPQQGDVGQFVLQANQWKEFFVSTAFEAVATKAVMVGQYLLGQQYPDPPAERGDPALTTLVPSEQYRKDYVFVAPSSYNAETKGQNFLLVTRSPGMGVFLDGNLVEAEWKKAGGWELGIVPINGGTHSIKSATEFGAIAYGLGTYTSYVYPIGLNLDSITNIIH